MEECASLNSYTYASNHSGELYPASKENIETLRFVAYRVIGPIILVLGLLGNASNLIVLTRPNMKGVTYLYLTWLAVSDQLYLFCLISLAFSVNGKQSKTYAASIYYSHFELPLINALMACSNFVIVALTVERFCSVCFPTKFKEIHNFKRAKLLIIAAHISAVILYIPSCFNKMSMVDPMSNGTQYISCDNPNVRYHPLYKAYLILLEIMVRFGPAVILTVLNTWIIVIFRKTLRKRRDLIGLSNTRSKDCHAEKKIRAEKRLINLLAGIVIFFFIGNTPAAILRLFLTDTRQFNFGFQVFRAIANLSEILNMAMNFYFYFMCCPEIRRTFIALFTRTKPTTTDSSAGSRPTEEL